MSLYIKSQKISLSIELVFFFDQILCDRIALWAPWVVYVSFLFRLEKLEWMLKRCEEDVQGSQSVSKKFTGGVCSADNGFNAGCNLFRRRSLL